METPGKYCSSMTQTSTVPLLFPISIHGIRTPYRKYTMLSVLSLFITRLHAMISAVMLTKDWSSSTWHRTCTSLEFYPWDSIVRLLLVGNLFQLHRPHQIWLLHEYCRYSHYYIIIQHISYNIHKIITVLEIHTLGFSVMHRFDFLT